MRSSLFNIIYLVWITKSIAGMKQRCGAVVFQISTQAKNNLKL